MTLNKAISSDHEVVLFGKTYFCPDSLPMRTRGSIVCTTSKNSFVSKYFQEKEQNYFFDISYTKYRLYHIGKLPVKHYILPKITSSRSKDIASRESIGIKFCLEPGARE
jgi:hypothetical protein